MNRADAAGFQIFQFMQMPVPEKDDRGNGGISRQVARRVVRLIQCCFLAIAIIQLDAPFLSAHNERQNQTYDVARHIFQEGWSAVLTPKASFSLPGYEARPFTIIRQEFPFHGLIRVPRLILYGLEDLCFHYWS